jgi:hypothetical protein
MDEFLRRVRWLLAAGMVVSCAFGIYIGWAVWHA